MTPYDAWRTNMQETNDEDWQEAVEVVAKDFSHEMKAEAVNVLANADDVLKWLCHAVEVPQTHLHTFRDLIKLASGLRKEVETEMKSNRMIPDED